MSAYPDCAFHLRVAETEDELVQNLSQVIKVYADTAFHRNGTFRLGVSGGSLVQLLTRALVALQLDTSTWKFFFCDERYVPHDHNDSTFNAYKTHMLTKLPSILESQFVKANTSLPLDKCAQDYETELKRIFGNASPEFDLLLLGMGPDGHTCSLFPEQPESLAEKQRLVIPISDSPKPPPQRITFTLPLLNNARQLVFVVTGASKSAVVKRVFEERDKELPSSWIEPVNGELTLIADAAAAASLTSRQIKC
ncbi:probable 6-phosphogluconolactonase [Drosophila sulfurigaster albostrigata]|uniref:probable 6-phosphogluconolactonase n=1 Tax=Drosophila sulfurigaster albostrigata TaxID=89887 RepID=UPI002D21E7DB|nr:probable 6-phosphogluconolactonase [Drosophila sulfurigaster albostrigata]